jgi:hypothetical protein
MNVSNKKQPSSQASNWLAERKAKANAVNNI